SAEVECTFRVSGKVPELWHADSGTIEVAPVWSERDGRITVPIHFDPAGSVFVVFRPAAAGDHVVDVTPSKADEVELAPKIEIRAARYEAVDGAGGADVTAKVAALVAAGETSIPANNSTFGDPTYNHVKRLRVEYALNGQVVTRSADENATLELVEAAGGAASLPTYRVTVTKPGQLELQAFHPGVYEFRAASGKTTPVQVPPVPEPVEIGGPWTVRFPPDWGAPASITLDKLISWTEHGEAGVRYFSGTAEYEREFDVPAVLLAPDKALYLDLGDVKYLAEVTLNGHDLGVWWKPPFAAEITDCVQPGPNTLKVRVTNLWVNRLVGDEQLPDDCEWEGVHLKRWPQWLLDGQAPRARERFTFTTWKHHTRDSLLPESGLLGPVMLRVAERVTIK
ncbi:MAG TPA: hypothetical protein PLQ87_06315, partial [Phycisphaerae bacterium]|nr:hypothetical protein [Phycisphaerae bacterium]